MGTIAEKLSYLTDTKDLFKDRLNSLGAEITSSTTFRNYLTWLDTFYGEVSDKTDLSVNGVIGRTSQETTRGINVFNVNSHYVLSDGYSINDEDWITNTYDNSQGIEHYENIWCRATSLLETSTNYLIVCEIKSVSGSGILYPYTKHSTSAIDTQHSSYSFSSLSSGQKILIPVTTKSSFSGLSCDLRTLVRYNEGNNGSITFRLSLLTDTSITSDTFVYEPFTNGASPNIDFPQPINNLSGDVAYKVRGKNLFDKNTINKLNGYFERSGDTIHSSGVNRVFYLECKPNTTYAFTQGETNISNHVFQVASTIEKPDIDVVVDNFVDRSGYNPYKTFTYTTNANAKYLVIRVRSGDTTNEFLDGVQIEENNEVTTYEPYIEPQTFNIPLGDIELCNIDTYEDKIYSSNGKFYLYKVEEKAILNGSENWAERTNTSSRRQFYAPSGITQTIKTNANEKQQLCNYGIYDYAIYNYGGYGKFGILSNTKVLYLGVDSNTVLEDFKTALTSNNLIAYCLLATPTTTEITSSNYPNLYNALKEIQDYLTAYKINKEFILGYSSPEIEY